MFRSRCLDSEVVNAAENGYVIGSDFVADNGEYLISIRNQPLGSENLTVEPSDGLLTWRWLNRGCNRGLGCYGNVCRARRKVDRESEAKLREVDRATGANTTVIPDDCVEVRGCRLDRAIEKKRNLATDQFGWRVDGQVFEAVEVGRPVANRNALGDPVSDLGG